MSYQKKTPITELAKKVLTEYYSNGMNTYKAYCAAKEIPVPKDKKKLGSIRVIVKKMRDNNPDFIRQLQDKNEKKYDKMKDELIAQLEDVSGTYRQMVTLALQDELSDIELSKFNRLCRIISTKDMNNAMELIGKLTGSFEAKKTEVTNTFKVAWGEAPQLQEANQGIIDVEYEDEE